MTHDPIRDGYRGATELRPDRRRALTERARAATELDARAREAFVAATAPSAEIVWRLRGRLHGPARPRGWGLAGAALAGAALAGALTALTLAVSRAPTEEAGLVLPLDDVQLSFAGEGSIGGTRKAPVVEWVAGDLTGDVTPDRGVALTVRTAEAVVRLVGTSFVVRRRPGTTSVSVSRGTARVACAGEPEVELGAGEQRTCAAPEPAPPPRSPADVAPAAAPTAEVGRPVRRVRPAIAAAAAPPAVAPEVERALRATGAPSERLAAIDAALAVAGDDPALVAELLARRVRALADAGRLDEALSVAEAVLSSAATARRPELAAFVGRVRFARSGCAAVPALELAVELDPAAPEGLLLATCLVGADPSRAGRLLDAARRPPELAPVADRLARALGRAP